MIRAYDISLFNHCLPAGDLLGYVRRTSVARTPEAVRTSISQYVERFDPAPEVREVLTAIADDPTLLGKTRIVTEGHWRNCVMLVTPSDAIATVGGVTFLDGKCDMKATLSYWRRNAEEIFIQLVDGQRRGRTPISESLEQLMNWLFKRNFRAVLATDGD